ncbi:hypothetical protein BpHYR1_000170 [Brachionus plicatilis]|uniref:Uncharacterized protein n=1 Tax=Brachionus plicatilis TaxID=10195 RepID=A0A3M7SEU0_BRAPC|nr:hypothetical protein BpHYR1_000170 [Brachionus plicatilis]
MTYYELNFFNIMRKNCLKSINLKILFKKNSKTHLNVNFLIFLVQSRLGLDSRLQYARFFDRFFVLDPKFNICLKSEPFIKY